MNRKRNVPTTASSKVIGRETGGQPPVLLLHGLGVDGRMWALQRDGLQKEMQKGGQVLVPDLPGFGRSPPLPPQSRLLEVYVDWVASQLRSRGPDAAAVAGYSMGGTLALLLALRHPELVSRLAICCSSACWGRGGRRWLADTFLGLPGNLAMEVFQGSVRWSSLRFTREPELRRELVDMVRVAHRPTMAALYRQLAAVDLRRSLAQIAVPTLVVCGSRDWLAPPVHSRDLQRQVPGAMLTTVRGAGHMLCLSHSAQLTQILIDFLR